MAQIRTQPARADKTVFNPDSVSKFRMSTPPDQHLLASSQLFWQLTHKAEFLSQRRAKGAHKGAFPQRETHQIQTTVMWCRVLLARDNGQHLLHFATLTHYRGEVARILNQRRCRQLWQANLNLAPHALFAVVSKIPARVKRHAKAIDRFAQQ